MDEDGGEDYENDSEPAAEKRGSMFSDEDEGTPQYSAGGDYQLPYPPAGYQPAPRGPPPPFQGGGYPGRRRRRQAPTPPPAGGPLPGVHRQSATASLAPSLVWAGDTMDLVLPTYWIFPPRVDVLQVADNPILLKSTTDIPRRRRILIVLASS